MSTATVSPKARCTEEELLVELVQYFPNVEEEFVEDIQKLTAKGVTYIDACVHWAEQRGIEDIAMLAPMIRRNLNLMSKITVDAENLNYIKKVPRLPI